MTLRREWKNSGVVEDSVRIMDLIRSKQNQRDQKDLLAGEGATRLTATNRA
jgi:hypothetical protein